MLAKRGKLILFVLLLLLLSSFNILNYSPAMAPQKEGELRIHFLDVGQGDSILIELPNYERMLVDGGTRKAGSSVVRYLKKLGIDKLEYVVATHPHEDHIGGLIDVFDRIPVGKVYMPKVVHTSQTYETFMQSVVDKGHRFQRARAGVAITEGQDLKVDILAPVGDSYESLNNYSAVIKLEYRNVGIILMGDAEETSEKEINTVRAKAQVLKVGHHGSRTSTSPEFLESVRPAYAVVSVGEGNDYGHPHTQTLELLNSAGVKVLRTDRLGTIVLSTDGSEIVFTSLE
jgi:competence protein ComEC